MQPLFLLNAHDPSRTFQTAIAAETASMAQYIDKTQNGVEGSCTVMNGGPGKTLVECTLEAKEVTRKQDMLFAEKDVVQVRPSLTGGSQCNDICHKRRNFEYDEPRAESCLGGEEVGKEWIQV